MQYEYIMEHHGGWNNRALEWPHQRMFQNILWRSISTRKKNIWKTWSNLNTQNATLTSWSSYHLDDVKGAQSFFCNKQLPNSINTQASHWRDDQALQIHSKVHSWFTAESRLCIPWMPTVRGFWGSRVLNRPPWDEPRQPHTPARKDQSIHPRMDISWRAAMGFWGLALLRVGKFELVILWMFEGKKNLLGGWTTHLKNISQNGNLPPNKKHETTT